MFLFGARQITFWIRTLIYGLLLLIISSSSSSLLSLGTSISCSHLMWFLMYSPLSICLSVCQITWHCRTMTVLQGGRAIRGVPPSVCSCRGNFSSFWCEVLQKEVSASKLIPGAPSQIRSENFIWLSFILWFTLSFLILLFGLTFVLPLHFLQMMFCDVPFIAFKVRSW